MSKKKPRRYPSGKKPKSAADILESTLGAMRLSHKVSEYAAFPHWKQIVGEEVAKVAVPEKIIKGRILVVRVLDAAWAQELTMQKTELINRMYESGLGAAIEDIHFLTGSPKALNDK